MAGVKQFSAKQKTAMTWWANPRYQEYDAIICDGAVRSGKTLSMEILTRSHGFSGTRAQYSCGVKKS